jgi:hypothetical protein
MALDMRLAVTGELLDDGVKRIHLPEDSRRYLKVTNSPPDQPTPRKDAACGHW